MKQTLRDVVRVAGCVIIGSICFYVFVLVFAAVLDYFGIELPSRNLTTQAKLPEDFVKTIKQPLLFVRMD
jgi:hypothetical protein